MLSIPGSTFATSVVPAIGDLGASIVEANAARRAEDRKRMREERARRLMKEDEAEKLARATARAKALANRLGIEGDFLDPADVASVANIEDARQRTFEQSGPGRAAAFDLLIPRERDAKIAEFEALDWRRRESDVQRAKALAAADLDATAQKRLQQIGWNEETNRALQDAGYLDVNPNVPGSRTNWGPVVPQTVPGTVDPQLALAQQHQGEVFRETSRHNLATEQAAMERADRPVKEPDRASKLAAAVAAYRRAMIMDPGVPGSPGHFGVPTEAMVQKFEAEQRRLLGLDGAVPAAPASVDIGKGLRDPATPRSNGKAVKLSDVLRKGQTVEAARALGYTVIDDTAGAPR